MTEDEQQPRQETQDEQDSRASDQRPLLKIIKGDATPEEIAALVAVLAALGSADQPPRRPTPEWSAHHRKLRVSHPRHRPGGWRSSGPPR